MEKIEGNVNDPRDLKDIYRSFFSTDLRQQFTEQDFLKTVQTGAVFANSAKLPPLSKRLINATVRTESRKNDWMLADKPAALGTVVEVQLVSAGRNGKMYQGLTMRCEERGWKVIGIDYEAR